MYSFCFRVLTTTISFDEMSYFRAAQREARPYTTVTAMRLINFVFVLLLLCLMEPCWVLAQERPGCKGRIRFAVISCLYFYICD